MTSATRQRRIFSNPNLAYRIYLVLEATRAYNGIVGPVLTQPEMAAPLVTVFCFKATLNRLRAS